MFLSYGLYLCANSLLVIELCNTRNIPRMPETVLYNISKEIMEITVVGVNFVTPFALQGSPEGE